MKKVLKYWNSFEVYNIEYYGEGFYILDVDIWRKPKDIDELNNLVRDNKIIQDKDKDGWDYHDPMHKYVTIEDVC